MRPRVIAGVGLVLLIAAAGLFLWARAVLGGDAVRHALAAQLSSALGQPVAVGSINTAIFPSLTVGLGDVAIGDPVSIHVATLSFGTNLRALLSRRIENASVRLDGARIELPLPEFAAQSTSADANAPVQIVSVDEIVLNDVEIVSGGRTVRGDIEAVLQGQRLTIEEATFQADDTRITATGEIADMSGPSGELKIDAGTLNVDRLLAFAGDFSKGITPARRASGRAASRTAPARQAPASAMNIVMSIDADRATMGAMVIEKLAGRATVTPDRVTIDPVGFELFGGRYDGTLAASLAGSAPAFQWKADLEAIDVASAVAFAGSPGTISGRLSGTINLAGRGADLSTAIKTARGAVRVQVIDGVVKHLGLVRSIVIATSMRADAAPQAAESTDERFTRLTSTLNVSNGTASTEDLRFESADVLLTAGGRLRLDGSDMSLAGKVQLSDALTAQAGRDLVRYTQEQGRVTLPVTIAGPAAAPRVRVDVADAAKRAIRNRAEEELKGAIERGLGGLIRK
jgi:uncharacterized protein involved in outer membrane biogenesis